MIMGRELKVEPPKNTLARRGIVLLAPVNFKPLLFEQVPVKGFYETASIVCEYIWSNLKTVGYDGFSDFH
jgi:hypothetical protein